MSRSQLAREQAALVHALVGTGATPAGFDATRVGALRASLLRKRQHEALHGWAGVQAVLGERESAVFAEYAALYGLPAEGGPFADGFYFVRFLLEREALPAELLRRLAEALLFHRATSRGLAPRRVPVAAVHLRGVGGSWALGVRLPLGGVHVTARPAAAPRRTAAPESAREPPAPARRA